MYSQPPNQSQSPFAFERSAAPAGMQHSTWKSHNSTASGVGYYGSSTNAFSSSSSGGNPTSSSVATTSTMGGPANYTSGYLLSSMAGSHPPSSSSPGDSSLSSSLPLIQTTARMNVPSPLFAGASATSGSSGSGRPDPISDSMFSSSFARSGSVAKRRTMTMTPGVSVDEDAPPRASVFDLPSSAASVTFSRPSAAPTSARASVLGLSALGTGDSSVVGSGSITHRVGNDPAYILVYGYPPDRRSVTIEYFQKLSAKGAAGTTGPMQPNDGNSVILNAFKLGYSDPGEALRAARKDGELLHLGSPSGEGLVSNLNEGFYIGVKLVGGSSLPETSLNALESSSPHSVTPSMGMAMDLDGGASLGGNGIPGDRNSPMAGTTPIKLQPASSAFKPRGPSLTPLANKPSSMDQSPSTLSPAGGPPQSPSKGMLGTVGDMLFGW